MSTIKETIARLRGLDRKASPAPWEAWGFGGDEQTTLSGTQWVMCWSATNAVTVT